MCVLFGKKHKKKQKNTDSFTDENARNDFIVKEFRANFFKFLEQKALQLTKIAEIKNEYSVPAIYYELISGFINEYPSCNVPEILRVKPNFKTTGLRTKIHKNFPRTVMQLLRQCLIAYCKANQITEIPKINNNNNNNNNNNSNNNDNSFQTFYEKFINFDNKQYINTFNLYASIHKNKDRSQLFLKAMSDAIQSINRKPKKKKSKNKNKNKQNTNAQNAQNAENDENDENDENEENNENTENDEMEMNVSGDSNRIGEQTQERDEINQGNQGNQSNPSNQGNGGSNVHGGTVSHLANSQISNKRPLNAAFAEDNNNNNMSNNNNNNNNRNNRNNGSNNNQNNNMQPPPKRAKVDRSNGNNNNNNSNNNNNNNNNTNNPL